MVAFTALTVNFVAEGALVVYIRVRREGDMDGVQNSTAP